MSDAYNDALAEQTKKNVWDRLKSEAAGMTPTEYASVVADVAGIFDPTPISDGVGLVLAVAQGDALGAALSLGSMVPYVGDALAKPMKIAKHAPETAKALEAMLKAGDELASAGQAALKQAGLSLEQVAAARTQALKTVQQAMLDARQRVPNCMSCKLVGSAGEQRVLQMPTQSANGKWTSTATGDAPPTGNGVFGFSEPRTLPDGRQVSEIPFKNGAPDFDAYVEGGKHQLWEVSGNADIDGARLQAMMRQQNPAWTAPDPKQYVLHHLEDGSVGYVPRVLHDKAKGGVGHTGGNSMINNQLF